MSQGKQHIVVNLGSDPDIVTIYRSGHSKPLIADALYITYNDKGEAKTIYLRCKIHNENKNIIYSGWKPTGAITTILNRIEDNNHEVA